MIELSKQTGKMVLTYLDPNSKAERATYSIISRGVIEFEMTAIYKEDIGIYTIRLVTNVFKSNDRTKKPTETEEFNWVINVNRSADIKPATDFDRVFWHDVAERVSTHHLGDRDHTWVADVNSDASRAIRQCLNAIHKHHSNEKKV